MPSSWMPQNKINTILKPPSCLSLGLQEYKQHKYPPNLIGRVYLLTKLRSTVCYCSSFSF